MRIAATAISLLITVGCKGEEKTAPGQAPIVVPDPGASATPPAAETPPPAPAATLTPEQATEAARTWLAALEKGDAAGLAAASATPFKLEHTGIEDHFACGALKDQVDAAALRTTATCLAGHSGLRAALAGATVQPTVAVPPPAAVQTPKFVAGWQADHIFIFFQLEKEPDPAAEVTHSLDGLLAVRLADGKPVVDGASLSYAALTDEGD